MNKAELRKYFLKKRAALSLQFVDEKSREIVKRIVNLDAFKQAKVIHCYASISKKREADTVEFISACKRLGKTIIMPKVLPKGEMVHIEVKNQTLFKENKWGVEEPLEGKSVQADYPDFIVVPMVAGDNNRNRIGYGKGYYDRFLSRTKGVKVGILFECQMFDGLLPTEVFDVPLDMLVNEKEVIC
ncbi:MAG: 5-formyltetrahydrofolate cyclo-ligase [Balneolaceae bacterium]|nr:MAG: 5-formyltetrahydrofolate cyclo-ligase [Balneolaceae bacterium]